MRPMSIHQNTLRFCAALAIVLALLPLMATGSAKETVAIVCNPVISQLLSFELSRFQADIHKDGFDTIFHEATESNPPELRQYLQSLYNDESIDLVGAILVGAVPTPRYRIYYPAVDELYQKGPYTGASYQYYEDLDGAFQLLDESQWLFEGHAGDVESEIWISVLPPLSTTQKTIDALRLYFWKNHLYRLGVSRPKPGFLEPIIGGQFTTAQLYNYQVDYALGKVPGSYQWSWGPILGRGPALVAPNNFLNDPVLFPGSNQVYYGAIGTGDYDFFSSSAHGSATGIGSNGYWYDRNYLKSNPVKVTFWFEGGCSTCDLDVVPSFGAVALYAEGSSVLAYCGATMDQGGLGGNLNGYFRMNIGTSLPGGKTVGQALLDHRSVPLGGHPAYAQQREYFAAQHILLGDGTLRLQEFQPSRIASEVDLRIDLNDKVVVVSFSTENGLQYELQRTTNLNSWTQVLLHSGDGNRFEYTPLQVESTPVFYRVAVLETPQ